MRLDGAGYGTYACRVAALADAYEDSPFSEFGYVRLSPDAIRQVADGQEGGSVSVYSLGGVLLARSREEMSKLAPGVYILEKDGATSKIVVK